MKPAVLVTGGARRIGAAISRAFAGAGWHVVIHQRAAQGGAEELAAELPSAQAIVCDLADGPAAETMIAGLATRLADWRVLVNSAAVFTHDAAEGIDPAIFVDAMAVNAASPVRMAQAFLRGAKAKSGRRVINITDMKIANPNPDFFSYTMSKHALAAATRMLAMAQKDPADRVYALAPGAILPSFDQRSEEHEISGRMNLLQRLTNPEEIAQGVLFLSQGWLASGETLFVDSGQHLLSQPRDVLYLARE
jgi:NAD(P)-dependent dehydrogenase (short-subunit alcohol dehydrogenase family)